MRTATLSVILCAALLRAQGDAGAHAFVEQTVARTDCFVGEIVRVQLRIGYDAAFFASSAIQPFQTRLDLPVQMEVPWFRKPPAGLRLLPVPVQTPEERRVTFALDDGPGEALAAGERTVGGRAFQVAELQRSFVMAVPGELLLEAPSLRYAYASQFDDDLLNGRVPRDRLEAAARGADLRLQVQPLPVQGRPPEFSGLVGRFRVLAIDDRRQLAVGETLRLQVRIEGDGDLAACSPPMLAWYGFLIHGPLDDVRPAQRTFTWDLVPLRQDVRAVPGVRIAYFDPEPPAGYRTIATTPLPLEVAPAAPGVHLPGAAGEDARVPGVDDLFDLKPVATRAAPPRLGPVLVIVALLVPWLLALWLLSWSRQRARRRNDPLGQRALCAHATLQAALARADGDAFAAFLDYLAARLRCPAAAVIGPQLATRLQSAGVPRELVADSLLLMRELGASRYGGDTVSDARARVAAMAQKLEAGFAQKEHPA